MIKIKNLVGIAAVCSVAGPCFASVGSWSPTKIATAALYVADCVRTLRALDVSHNILQYQSSALQNQKANDPFSRLLLPNEQDGSKLQQSPDKRPQGDPVKNLLKQRANAYIRHVQSLRESLAEIEHFQKAAKKAVVDQLCQTPSPDLVNVISVAGSDLAGRALGGDLHVLSSVMTGGKTAKLVDYAQTCQRMEQPFEVFFPKCAYGKGAGISRNGSKLEGQPIGRNFSFAIHNYFRPETKVLLVDEGHFLNKRQALELILLSLLGYKVIVAGLAVDFKGDPFQVISLLSSLDNPPKDALCPSCGKFWATQHVRTNVNKSHESVNVGQDNFASACIRCWLKVTYGDKNYSYWINYVLDQSGIVVRPKNS